MCVKIFLVIILSCLLADSAFGDADIAYVGGLHSNNIWRVNLTDGSFSALVNVSGVPITDVESQNSNILFFSSQNENLYRYNITSDQYSVFTSISGSSALRQIAFANDNSAYVMSTAGNLYRVDLTNATSTLVTSVSGFGSGVALNKTLFNNTIAYITAGSSIYKVDLVNATSTLFATIPGTVLKNIELRDNNTAFVDADTGVLYQVNLVNGTVTALTTISGGFLEGIELSNYTTAYVSDETGNRLYSVNLSTGTATVVNATAFTSGSAVGVTLHYTLPGFGGNNQSFVDYLLNNTPYRTTSLLILQPNVAAALNSAIPTRNAIGTYAAQNTYMSMGQTIWNHLGQNRWNSLKACQAQNDSQWFSTFGEYTRERAQQQTPSFHTATAGAIFAYESELYGNNPERFVLGAGASYAYTHVREDGNAGQANVQQGSVFVYSSSIFDASWCKDNYYIDAALSGGLYAIDNTRIIALEGLPIAEAVSNHNGWQISPHLEVGVDQMISSLYTDFGIESFIMLDAVNCWEDGFMENGAGILNAGINSRFGALFRGETGFRLNHILTCRCGTINLREKISGAYQKTYGHTGTLSAFLPDSSGTFTVSTLMTGQTLAVAAFDVVFMPASKALPYTTISYQGQCGSKYLTQEGKISFGWRF